MSKSLGKVPWICKEIINSNAIVSCQRVLKWNVDHFQCRNCVELTTWIGLGWVGGGMSWIGLVKGKEKSKGIEKIPSLGQ